MSLRSNDTTLRSLRDRLDVEYVRAILSQVRDCEASLGDARLRVSLNSEMDPPHYRIDAVMDLTTGETTQWHSFSGKTHKPLSERQSSTVVWSLAQMTLREVSDLIGDMRNYTRKRKIPDAT